MGPVGLGAPAGGPAGLRNGAEPGSWGLGAAAVGLAGLGHGAEPSSGPVGLGWVADPVGGAGVLGIVVLV